MADSTPPLSILKDVVTILTAVEACSYAPLQEAVRAATKASTEDAAKLLPSIAQPKKTTYVIRPAATTSARESFTPWTPRAGSPRKKSDYSAFQSEIASYLRGAAPSSDPKKNLGEAGQLWTKFKEVGTLDEIIAAAKEEIREAIASAAPEA
jgi:NAD(P)H-dependent flavin oxidoreductase YrpB (nitropropane dioxygenase family)